MTLGKRDRILIAAIGAVLLLGGFWYLIVRPASSEASAARDEVERIESENNAIRDTLTRLAAEQEAENRRGAERLRLVKALPTSASVPGAIVQLERLAKKSNVELSGVSTTSSAQYGPIQGTLIEVRVRGRFFDVDDFLFRMHRLVSLDRGDEPQVEGRLLATTSIELSLAPDAAPTAPGSSGPDVVSARLAVIAYHADDLAAAMAATGAAAAAAGAEPEGAATQ